VLDVLIWSCEDVRSPNQEIPLVASHAYTG